MPDEISISDPAVQLVEALVFAAPEPVDAGQLCTLVADLPAAQIPKIVEYLNQEYERTGRGFRIIRGGGGWRFATRPEFSPWVKRLAAGLARMRLTRPGLETLSLIAYRQPVTRAAVEAVRGVDVSGVLKLLLERKLIRVTGREPRSGRALLYGTTSEFLRYFGIDSLDDLPRPGELADLRAGGDPSAPQGRIDLFTENSTPEDNTRSESPAGAN